MKRPGFLKGSNGPQISAQSGCRINESPDLILWLLPTRAVSVQMLVHNKHADMNPYVEECTISLIHLSRFVHHKLSTGRIRPFKTQY